MALKLLPRLSKPGTIALLALLLPAACASDAVDMNAAKDINGEAVAGGVSMSGNYLAGRHAQASRDMPGASKYLGKALSLSPGTPDLMRRTFIMMASEGRIREASELAVKLIATKTKTPVAHLTIIVEEMQKDRFEAASQKINTLPDGGLNGYMAPLLSAWTSLALGKTADQATAELKPLLKDGSKALHYLHKAIILDFKGDHQAAEKAYLDEIREQGGVSLRVVELLGNLYERTGKADKALALYKNFGKSNPRSPVVRQSLKRLSSGVLPKPLITTAKQGMAEAFLDLATTLSQQNARETGLIFARMGLYLRPNFPVMQILLGNILQADEQFENANSVYRGIDPVSPYSWPARLRVAENMDDLEQTEDAVKTLNAMAEEQPSLADPLIRLGDILRSRERFDEAVSAYDRAIKRVGNLQSHHWSLLYARGIVLERSRKWDRAEADFLKALEFDPDQPFVLNYLGYSWIDQGKNLSEGKKMIQKAVKLRPNDGYIVDSLGWAHFRLGEFSDSVKEMERAVELRPEDPVLNDHFGDSLWRVGRKVEARYQWQRVLTLDPDDGLRTQVKGKLNDGLPEI
jgi:tetratricopeptide (TPR) repeat protein